MVNYQVGKTVDCIRPDISYKRTMREEKNLTYEVFIRIKKKIYGNNSTASRKASVITS
jgi:hypothetical protein